MIEPKLRFKADDGSQFPNWERKKIVNVSDRVKVGFVGTCECYYTDESGIRLYRTGNLQKGRLVEDDMKYVLKKFHEANKKSQLHKWDILIARHGNSGNAVLYDSDEEANCLNIVIIRPDLKVINPKFMVENINSASVEKQVCRLKNGSTQVVLNTKAIEDLDVGIPCLPEQHKIAEFLSTIDTVIEKQKETVSAWEERKKGVMQKLFSQEVRFKADDGSNFPEWEKKKIGDVAYLNPKTGTIPNEFYYMDLGGVDRGSWRDKKVVLKEEAPSRAQRIAMLGDCFFQSVRPLNMGHYLLKNKLDKPVVASTGFIQMRMKKDICPDFIFQLLFDENLNKEVELRCTGQTYPAINVDRFSDIAVRVPCLAEQQKIADCLSSLDDVIEKQKATLAVWEEMKKGLLQQMFV